MNQSLSCIVVSLQSLERRRAAYLNILMFMLDIFERNISYKQGSSVDYQIYQKDIFSVTTFRLPRRLRRQKIVTLHYDKNRLTFCDLIKFLLSSTSFISSYQRCSIKKRVLKNITKFTGKHLCQSLLFDKQTLAQVFFCEFCQISRAPFLQNSSGRLLLIIGTPKARYIFA